MPPLYSLRFFSLCAIVSSRRILKHVCGISLLPLKVKRSVLIYFPSSCRFGFGAPVKPSAPAHRPSKSCVCVCVCVCMCACGVCVSVSPQNDVPSVCVRKETKRRGASKHHRRRRTRARQIPRSPFQSPPPSFIQASAPAPPSSLTSLYCVIMRRQKGQSAGLWWCTFLCVFSVWSAC